MLARLTWRLAALPEQTWPRFAVAHGQVAHGPQGQRGQGEPYALPSPLKHIAAAGFTSVLATGLGWSIRPGATSAGAVLQMLMAVVGYVGGGALATLLSPALLQRADIEPELLARYASGAVLPLALCGLGNVVPMPLMSFALALAGAALSVHSGWVGASAMLALEGQARKRAAVVPAGLAVSLVLLATFVRMVLPK
jgi:hypothetical protein